MAIQIIKNTMVDPIEMTCECCKSVFSYNYQDIQRKQEVNIFSSTIRRIVTCPVCKYDNDVNKVVVELQKDEEEELVEPEKKERVHHCGTCAWQYSSVMCPRTPDIMHGGAISCSNEAVACEKWTAVTDPSIRKEAEPGDAPDFVDACPAESERR